MKIFNTIKKQIASLFNKYEVVISNPIQSVLEEYSDCDGPTNVNLNSIHSFASSLKMSQEELDSMLKKTLSTKNLSRIEKKKVLLEIYSDCLELHGALIPLIELDIVYSIDLVGGAVRDFLLDNQTKIKDLDILVSLSCGYSRNINRKYSHIIYESQRIDDLVKKGWCTEEELQKVEFNDDDLLYKKHNKLVQLCLNRHHELSSTQIFSKEERKTGEINYGTDVLKELSGIIKVESKSLKYPMEILLTDQSREVFFKAIDFGLCNVGFKIVVLGDDNKMKLISFSDIQNNCIMSVDFLEDIKYKTITYNTYNKSFEQIDFSLTNHLKRLVEKYPDHKFQLSENNITEDTRKNIDTVMLVNKLSDNLEIQENFVQVKRKNKI